jgi:hypothetical protein
MWTMEIGQLGHDDGSDSQVKAAVVTRCLSPLGTGNDETGSAGPSATSADLSTGLLVSHCALLVEIGVVRSSTAIAFEINIAVQKDQRPRFEPTRAVIIGSAT